MSVMNNRDVGRLLRRSLSRVARDCEREARRCRVLAAVAVHRARCLPRHRRREALLELLALLEHRGCPADLAAAVEDMIREGP
jgi:hypothetical protein